MLNKCSVESLHKQWANSIRMAQEAKPSFDDPMLSPSIVASIFKDSENESHYYSDSKGNLYKDKVKIGRAWPESIDEFQSGTILGGECKFTYEYFKEEKN